MGGVSNCSGEGSSSAIARAVTYVGAADNIIVIALAFKLRITRKKDKKSFSSHSPCKRKLHKKIFTNPFR